MKWKKPSSSDFPGTYEGYEDSWDLEKLKKNLQIQIQSISEDKLEMEFDLIGVDASIANAFRRILLAEVCLLFNSYYSIYYVYVE